MYAIFLAKWSGAKLLVMFVVTKDLNDEDIKLGELSVKRVVHWAILEGVDAEGHIEHGPVVKTIQSIAELKNVDLVVSSARHEHQNPRYFVRSISQQLMRALSCSMIVVRVAHSGKTLQIKKILVPVIGGAYHAAERAYLISRLASHAHVTVLRVEKISRTSSLLMTHAKKHTLSTMGREKVLPFAKELSKHDIQAEIQVDFAQNYERAILKKAASGHFDLILMGATKRDIVRQIVHGNPVEEILRKTPCDVLIWHPMHD